MGCAGRTLAWLAAWLVRLVGCTSRARVVGNDPVEGLRSENRPLVFLFWHRHIFHLIYHFRGCGARPLISRSADGELMARVAAKFGMRPVRGSSSRGGARAFLELVRSVEADPGPVLITADGPRGPARQVKPGAVELARLSGACIVPVSWYGTRLRVLGRSWDRFLLPLPGGRIVLRYGEAVTVPRGADTGALCRELGMRLDQLEQAAAGDCQGTAAGVI